MSQDDSPGTGGPPPHQGHPSPSSAPVWPGAAPDAGPPSWTAPPGASPAPPAPAAPGPSPASAIPAAPQGAPTYRSWQPGILPLRPLSFGDFLAAPFRALRFNRAVMIGAPLLFTLISTVLTLTTLWVVLNDPQLGLLSATPTVSGISGETIALIVVAIAAALLADVFSSSIIAPGVARAVLGERITIGTAWKQVRHRLGTLLLLYLVAFAAMCACLLVAFSPLLLALTGDGAATATGVVLTIVACLAIVPVFLAVTVVQGVARALIVLEDAPFAQGLRRAFRLIHGRFWWSMLIVFVAAILINIAAAVLQNVGQFGGLAVTLVAPDSTAVVAVAFFVVYGIAYVVSMVVVYAYLGAIFALIYVDVRMRHEGFDVDLARAAEARAASRTAWRAGNATVRLTIPVEPDADEARRWAVDELAKSDYGDEPATWLARVGEWLRGLVDGFDGFGSGLGPGGIILVIVVAAALTALVVWLVMGPLRRSRRAHGVGAVLGDDGRAAAQMETSARAAAASRDWDTAVTELYRALVRRLHESGVVRITAGMTADEAARAIGTVVADARGPVAAVARDFDVARYGTGGLTESAWTRALATYETFSSAPSRTRADA